jgi:leucyl-tRNA synthetase
MSKSVGNVVDPNNLIDTYGADTARLFVMFAAPPEQSLEWSDTAVEGAHRFLKRIWAFAHQHQQAMSDINDLMLGGNGHIDWDNTENRLKKSRMVINQILMQASNDYERHQFNTVVSGCMKLFNELSNYEISTEEDKYFIHSGISILLRLLAPITPHICHHIWQQLGFDKVIIDAPWPKVDKNALKSDELDFVVQINGKLRAQFTAGSDTPEETLIEMAKQHTSAFLVDKSVKKAVVVPHRQLINLVV